MITPQALRDHATDDHERGCQGREYSCTCDYDKITERLLRAAAKRIEELEAINRGYRFKLFDPRELEALRRETEGREKP